MAEEMLTSRSDFGKTFTTAMWLLGAVAATQVFAVGWAVVTRPESPRVADAGSGQNPTPAAPPSEAAVGVNVRPDSVTQVIEDFDPFALVNPPMIGSELPETSNAGVETGATFTGPASAEDLLPIPDVAGPPPVPPLSMALSEAALSGLPANAIEDPAVEQLVSTGAEMRSSGNMQGALNALRQAEAVLPEQPRVLSEIAATYSEMGLVRKASIYWRKVTELGADRGGAYFQIAERELEGERLAAPASRSILRLGQLRAIPDPAASEGQRVVLQVTVEAEAQSRPSPSDMVLLVYFYDKVDGKEVQASTADTSQNFISTPYNWQDGSEVIEVIYHQPEFTEIQKRELGTRQYHGYIVELFYRDELQDTAAEPPDLSSLDPGAAPPVGGAPAGPDAALFPEDSAANE